MLCSIYYLADKYNINALEKKTLKVIKSKEISVKNIIDVGVLAIQYAVHDKLAEALYAACAQRLSRIFIFNGELSEALKYLSKIDADDSLDLIGYKSLTKIMARLIMRDMITPAAMCSNCKAFPCKTGVRLSRDNIVLGAKITAADAGGLDAVDHVLGLYYGALFSEVFTGGNKDGPAYACCLKHYKFKC